MTQKEILTTFEAARLCHVSYNTIKNWIKKNLIGAYRTAGGHIRIRTTELEAFCREQGIPMEGEAEQNLRRVLIVDDDETVRLALQEVMRQYSEKFEVYTAADGFDAGSVMMKVKPDLIILDLIMPCMDGFKVLQSIRKTPELKHTKVVILTGFPSEKNFEKATSLGADLCLAKPLDRSKLYDAIMNLMEPRRGVRGRRRKQPK